MRLKCIAIATVLVLGMIISSCQPSPQQIHTYKVYLYDGSEYTVRGTGFYTHHKHDSVQTVIRGGGSFFNVKAVVQVSE